MSYFDCCKAFETVSAGSSLEIMRSLLSSEKKVGWFDVIR